MSGGVPSVRQSMPNVFPVAQEDLRAVEPDSDYLDIRDRPQAILKRIETTFRKIETKDNWVYNGKWGYNLCGVNEHNLLLKIIQESPENEKDIWVIDIGCGTHAEEGTQLANTVNRLTNFPLNKTVHIVNLQGQVAHLIKGGPWGGDRLCDGVTTRGRCRLYDFCHFRIENLVVGLERRGLFLKDRAHLILARWSLIHTVDFVGNVLNIHSLLKPQGFFLHNGGYYLEGKVSQRDCDYNAQLVRLFSRMQFQFLMQENHTRMAPNHFIMKRTLEGPCYLPMKYVGLEEESPRDMIFYGTSQSTVRFQLTRHQPHIRVYMPDEGCPYLYGSKTLFEDVKQHNIFNSQNPLWHPLTEEDERDMQPSLHRAIKNNDVEAFEAHLTGDVNESDFQGNTPLHLAVQKERFDFFTQLLERKVRIDFRNALGRTALEDASELNDERFAIALLREERIQKPSAVHRAANHGNMLAIHIALKQGYDIDTYDHTGRTLLHIAIENKNVDLCAYLLKMGADPNLPIYRQFGKTALYLAVEACAGIEIIKLLIAHHADNNVTRQWMEDLVERAEELNSSPEVIALFQTIVPDRGGGCVIS